MTDTSEQIGKLQPGTYSAVASGCYSIFTVNGVTYRAKFPIAVKGINIRGTVTVGEDNTITSSALGKNGEIDIYHKPK